MTLFVKAVLAITFSLANYTQPITLNDSFEIIGTTQQIADGTEVALVDVWTNKSVASTTIQNNTFTFTGTVGASPRQMIIIVQTLRQYKYIWVENGKIIVDAANADLYHASVLGSQTQKTADKLFAATD